MALKVLISPDKFKGTLTALEAARAMAAGWRTARPDDELELLPISDGGDGFGEVMSDLLGAQGRSVKTIDAAHRPCEALWWWHAPSRTAIIESARIIGLAQLPAGKYHPFELDTQGLGPAFKAAAEQGAKNCLVGIGGSATNDGGFGVARALGWQFFGTHDEKIVRWTELKRLAQVRPPERLRIFDSLTVAVDVRNPLLSRNGCTRVFGPQKGLSPDDFEFAERCLEQLARVMAKELHVDCAGEPGAGAAGGLGFGLRCFAGAELEPGFALFARHAQMEARLQKSQVVLTGEGSIDDSTGMGKGVGELARLCRQSGVPCLGLGGVAPESGMVRDLFTETRALTPDLVSPAEAVGQAALWLEKAAAKTAAEWRQG